MNINEIFNGLQNKNALNEVKFSVAVILSCHVALFPYASLPMKDFASWRGVSDSITDSSMLLSPADAQNVSCLGLCGRDICPRSSA